MKRFNKSFFVRRFRLMLLDTLFSNVAFFAALLLSYNFQIKNISVYSFFYIPLSLIFIPLCIYVCGTHRITWRHAGFRDIFKLSVSLCLGSAVSLVCAFCTSWGMFGLLEAMFVVLFGIVASVSLRMFIRHIAIRTHKKTREMELHRTGDLWDYGKSIVIGAGTGAEILLRSLFSDASFTKCDPVAVVDDNKKIHGSLIRGVPVIGSREDIPEIVRKNRIKTIFFAIPSATNEERREILKICSSTGCDVRILPAVDESLDNTDPVSKIRKVSVFDLLGREPIRIDVNKICGYVEGKVVMVTGGGGSIGSELCRQIAERSPKKLIIFDIYENSTYDILNELKRNHPEVDVLALIGSVRDEERLNSVFDEYRPEIVYHAAAHKHVPLMEDSPHEAVKNNVFGTFNTVRAADKFGTKRFVMISTDKAVNPTNIMGTTKRLCEMIIQAYNKKSSTEYVAVRFGNVLGSNGSVIPLFEKQIAEGGPVTVTHPDIIRYFMTIPEAVSLVLSAGASAKGGEIFVLDMGEPVKILDLAENMIRLSGFEPYHDINIEFTGLRPGEKLYEELLMDEEGLQKTDNSLIYIGQPISLDDDEFFSSLEELWKVACDEDSDIRAALHKMVPTFNETPCKKG
ncbi:MAG: polysaccharide biosynthesis protein [Ruminococcaceae bacterium]|nr:polysaccharide biosynthesis protein [Oscillospiraceae bacterium]